MNLALVVAMDEQGTIGREGGLPWRLSADLRHVKAVTMGKPIIMGRRTHESIGRPLPGRENIIISRQQGYHSPGCRVFSSFDTALQALQGHPEVVIMGGVELYRQALDIADSIYLTEVHARVQGDTYFPDFDRDMWREVSREDFRADEKNEFDYSFVVLKRD
jgi:dihydrofolate reductase